MSASKKDNKQAGTTAEKEEAPQVQSGEPERSAAEEEPTEGDLLGGGAGGAVIGGLVGGAGGAAIGGMLGLTRGALREGGKKKRSGW
jgi:predicted lipid-binding transport protein (Tim44 family)